MAHAKFKDFTVVRSKWLRGGRDGNGNPASSTLKNDAGHMCCMGFFAEANGLGTVGGSLTVDEEMQMPSCFNYAGNGSAYSWLYEDNDRATTSDAEKEARIAALLALDGITVTFVD